MPRFSIRSMIVRDLGYCCPWFFFSRFRRTALIAFRLGVTPQAVRACRSTCGGCEGKPECLDKKITLKRTLRRQAEEI